MRTVYRLICILALVALPATSQTLDGGNLTSGVSASFTLPLVSEPKIFGNWWITVPSGVTQLKVDLEIATPDVKLSFYVSTERVYIRQLGGGYYGVVYRYGTSRTASYGNPGSIILTPSSDPTLRAPETYCVAIETSTLKVPANVTVTATVGAGTPSVSSVSAATFKKGAALAPESMASAFGQNLAASTVVATTLPLPTSLGETETTVKVKDSAGEERLAPLFFVSPGQVNYLIPAGTQAGAATVTVSSRKQMAGTGTVLIEAVAPGLFTANASGQGVAAAAVLRVAADGAQTVEPAFHCGTTAGSCVPAPIDLGAESDQVFLMLFGTGIRGRSNLSAVKATIGVEVAEVVSAGAQGEFVGLDQVNLRVPRRLQGKGEVNVILTVDGKTANAVTVSVGP